MLKRLLVKNFTVFAEADFKFGPGLNVVVGTNGTGKSHVLKVGYAVLENVKKQHDEAESATAQQEALEQARKRTNRPIVDLRKPIKWALTDKIQNVFRLAPNLLSELIRRKALEEELVIQFEVSNNETVEGNLSIKPEVTVERFLSETVEALVIDAPVFIPAKEILTLGWMKPASAQLKLPLDESYLDLLNQLSGLPLQNPGLAATAVLQQLTNVLGGEVEEDNGRFYLVFPKEKRLEMNMVAEGLRKFGTLQKLLANGSLTPQATLFWDEPEANLNPALLKQLAAVLTDLASQGFQIILATHSLFLLKELHVLAQQQKSKVRYFGLYSGPAGDTRVEQTDDLETLSHLAALDEELTQTARFQRVLDEDFFQPDSQLPE